ncbi:MAG: helix-turn-helix domain-containing protein [Fibromonadaceae bacterium]|jgi:transcriptional regulator with XRE-family HTH domain|nr:helix-turn-helix domain-containing protein [Fibromonadaceae bacterium]
MAKTETTDSIIWALKNLLVEERKKLAISQLELAQRSGLTRQSISLFENGQRTPSLSSLISLAKGFDVPVVRFVFLFMGKFKLYKAQERKRLATGKKRSETS